MSASPYCFLGKVDENRTDPTSYVISSEQTHSATSTNAGISAQSERRCEGCSLLDSEGNVFVIGPFDVRTCNLVSGFSDDLTDEEGLAVVASTTGAFPSRIAFSLADFSARSFLSA
jgi:hypothetical protein